MALAIQWANPADTIELANRAQGKSGAFVPVTPTVRPCPTHGFASFDLAASFGGQTSVPALEWRLVHKSGSVAQTISDDDLLAFIDLNVKADVSFDSTSYRTGDPMIITARLRVGNQVITAAKVEVLLARPGESLGTFLSNNAPQGTTTTTYRPTSFAVARTPDPPHPKSALLQPCWHRRAGPNCPF